MGLGVITTVEIRVRVRRGESLKPTHNDRRSEDQQRLGSSARTLPRTKDHPQRGKGPGPSRNSEENPGLVAHGSSPPDTEEEESRKGGKEGGEGQTKVRQHG